MWGGAQGQQRQRDVHISETGKQGPGLGFAKLAFLHFVVSKRRKVVCPRRGSARRAFTKGDTWIPGEVAWGCVGQDR